MDVPESLSLFGFFINNSCCREFEVEILDREFDPPILVIQEGDRVWWYWDKDKVRSSQWSPDNGPLVFLNAYLDRLH